MIQSLKKNANATTTVGLAIIIITTLVVEAAVGNELNYLPLIPYHRNRERRRSLISAAAEENNSNITGGFHHTRHRHLDAIQVGALYQGYGTHYVDLWVGTPNPQRQTLIVDTGSGVSAFPCSGCKDNCGDGHHIDKVFDETLSKTFTKVPCDACMKGTCSKGNTFCKISMSYQEGSSWYAFEARDMAYIGGPHDHGILYDNGGDQDIDPNHAKAFSFDMTFGCQTKLTGLFKTQLADGIMGMDIADTAFHKQMYEAKKVPSLEFSLCFTRQPTAKRDGTEAGAMTMGGYDERLHKSPLVFTSNNSKGGRGFYNVHIRKIYLRHGSGGESALSSDPNATVRELDINENQLNSGRIIVDSGTTDTYLSSKIAVEFKKAFKELTGVPYSHQAVKLTDKELHALPTVLIQFEGDESQNKELYPDLSKTDVGGLAYLLDKDHPYDVLIAIPASHYMEYDDKQSAYINRFYVDEHGGSVLGANTMMGHDVYFDQENKRIGWAESDCDYYSLLSNNGFIDTLVPDSDDQEEQPEVVKKTASNNDNPHETNNNTPNDNNAAAVHPALVTCNGYTCQGALWAGFMVLFVAIGVVLGRRYGGGNYNRLNGEGDDDEMEMKGLVVNQGRYSDEIVEEKKNSHYDDTEVMLS